MTPTRTPRIPKIVRDAMPNPVPDCAPYSDAERASILDRAAALEHEENKRIDAAINALLEAQGININVI